MIDPQAISRKFYDLLHDFNDEVFRLSGDLSIPDDQIAAALCLPYVEIEIVAARIESLIAAAMGNADAAIHLLTIAKEMARSQVLSELQTMAAKKGVDITPVANTSEENKEPVEIPQDSKKLMN